MMPLRGCVMSGQESGLYDRPEEELLNYNWLSNFSDSFHAVFRNVPVAMRFLMPRQPYVACLYIILRSDLSLIYYDFFAIN